MFFDVYLIFFLRTEQLRANYTKQFKAVLQLSPVEVSSSLRNLKQAFDVVRSDPSFADFEEAFFYQDFYGDGEHVIKFLEGLDADSFKEKPSSSSNGSSAIGSSSPPNGKVHHACGSANCPTCGPKKSTAARTTPTAPTPTPAPAPAAVAPSVAAAVRAAERKKVPRNSVCPCGSGQKYKKCCLAKDEKEEAAAIAAAAAAVSASRPRAKGGLSASVGAKKKGSASVSLVVPVGPAVQNPSNVSLSVKDISAVSSSSSTLQETAVGNTGTSSKESDGCDTTSDVSDDEFVDSDSSSNATQRINAEKVVAVSSPNITPQQQSPADAFEFLLRSSINSNNVSNNNKSSPSPSSSGRRRLANPSSSPTSSSPPQASEEEPVEGRRFVKGKRAVIKASESQDDMIVFKLSGDAMLSEGRVADAVTFYSQALLSKPVGTKARTVADLYLARARAYQRLGLPSKSRDDCLKAAEALADSTKQQQQQQQLLLQKQQQQAHNESKSKNNGKKKRADKKKVVTPSVNKAPSENNQQQQIQAKTLNLDNVATLQVHLQPMLASIVAFKEWIKEDGNGPFASEFGSVLGQLSEVEAQSVSALERIQKELLRIDPMKDDDVKSK